MKTAICAVILLSTAARADEPAGGAKVYRTAVPSVVWIHSARPNGSATGSGTLIDRDRRLVLTNYHVVEDNPRATVFFPQFRDGQPIPERSYYADRAGRLGVRGRVVALDKQADLAVIQIAAVPDGVNAIPLAATNPEPGDSVHSIGNAGKSGALWGYIKGTVRQVYRKEWQARLDPRRVVTFKAKVIETDSATNHGDSGGPLLNDRGELAGVTEGGAVNAQLISTFIDVSEVKQVLATRAIRDLKGDAAPAVKDEAKLFSADAVRDANAVLAELHKRGLDALVEAYPKAPAAWIGKAKAANPEERKKLFREWAAERLRAEDANGFAVLVCLDPRFAAVEVPEEAKDRLPDGFAKTAGDALLAALKKGEPDEGLKEVLRLAKEGSK